MRMIICIQGGTGGKCLTDIYKCWCDRPCHYLLENRLCDELRSKISRLVENKNVFVKISKETE